MNPADFNAHLSDLGRCIVELNRVPARSTLAGVQDGVRELLDQRNQLLLVAGADLLHDQYRPAAVDYDCCSTCNRLTSGYVAWPCPVASSSKRTATPTNQVPGVTLTRPGCYCAVCEAR